MRLLSADAEVRRITIRNVHGNFYCYAVGLTHGFSDNPPGRMEDIAIADVYAAKALPPKQVDAPYRRAMSLVWVEGPANIGNLSVERIHRDESTLPSDTICIGANATVRRLTVRGCKMDNRLDKPIRFIGLDGTVETLVKENNEFLPSPSMWSN